MDNKLSELSKPAAYGYQIASACIADGDDKKWVDWSNKLTHECPPDWMVEDGKVTELKPLYSQEYVTALQQHIADLEEIKAAAEKLVRCKGRYHSEQNYRALAALFGVTTPDLPPVEGGV